ncbi:MAG: hypothetical protein AABO58_02565 [Acidobacteriota bacterium]
MPVYEALAHVLWELPFPLRLAPEIIPVWEPGEGIAFFDPRPEVGELSWRRTPTLLQRAEVLPDAGPENNWYPEYDYRLNAHRPRDERLTIAQINRGALGGFIEPRQYTSGNIILCLRNRQDAASGEAVGRAAEALNNILAVYRFVTLDPLVRELRADLDTYYTLVSVGELPQLGDIDPLTALQAIDRVHFGRELGITRFHTIGANSFSDLFAPEPLRPELLTIFDELVRAPHDLELFHQLMFSAIRRVKRHEHALAVFDAQSALETLVASILVERLRANGRTEGEVEQLLAPGGEYHQLQRRLRQLDRFAEAESSAKRFIGSPEEQRWRTTLYNLRNQIAHAGRRDVTFADAKDALMAGMHAIFFIQDLAPSFGRTLSWGGTRSSAHR